LPGRLQSALGTEQQGAVFFRTENQIAIVDRSTRQVRNVIRAR
jgi:hypothetical protein